LAGGWYFQWRRVQSNWQQALAALDRHDLDSASTCLDQYLESRPQDAAAWFLAARTARRRGYYAEAERCLTRSQQISGVTAATRLEWDLFRIQQGDLGDTHIRLRATISPQHPDAAMVLEALAQGYLSNGRLMDALEASDMWVAQNPDDPWSWLWRGRAQEKLVKLDPALADYEQALRIAPQDRNVRLALGALLVHGRQAGKAAEHFEYVLEHFPDDRDAQLGLASCRIDLGESVRAEPLLERILASDPTEARALVLRGKAAMEQGDPSSAERWLKTAVQQAPENIEACHQLILVLRAEGKYTEADARAAHLEALNQDIERMDWLAQAVARSPEDAALRHEAGTIALRLGRDDDGVRWLQSALRCPGDHRPTHAALAKHFAARKDPRADLHRRLAQVTEP
jgi:tetratricopeptide (TPR) repeat protein